MSERKDAIKKLSQSVIFADGTIVQHGWKIRYLDNIDSSLYCQVFECSSESGQDVCFPFHQHEKSEEVFYQVKGKSNFSDGQNLKPGELKVIPANVLHSVTLSSDGLCIIIVHPIENAYARG